MHEYQQMNSDSLIFHFGLEFRYRPNPSAKRKITNGSSHQVRSNGRSRKKVDNKIYCTSAKTVLFKVSQIKQISKSEKSMNYCHFLRLNNIKLNLSIGLYNIQQYHVDGNEFGNSIYSVHSRLILNVVPNIVWLCNVNPHPTSTYRNAFNVHCSTLVLMYNLSAT